MIREHVLAYLKQFFCAAVIAVTVQMSKCVEIRRLSVPRWVQNGTEDSVVLDCDYSWNENDLRLVVKWFFENNTEPVYQWIPELNLRHTSGVLKNKLDMDFSVNTVDHYSKYRALRIPKPSTELSGKYTCLVTSLAGQDSREQVMTVFTPANEFELSYIESDFGEINVTCEARDMYPKPGMKLYTLSSASSRPQPVQDVKVASILKSNGAFDTYLQRTFSADELSESKASVFECSLQLPGTNYIETKRTKFFPGSRGSRTDAQHVLAAVSQASSLPSLYLVATIACLILFTVIYGQGNYWAIS